MDATGKQKALLREGLLSMRQELAEDNRARIDRAIAKRAIELAEYQSASAVFTYLSVGAEVDTRAIIRNAWNDRKTVAIPRCIPGTREMTWHVIHDFGGLETSSIGVEEPANDPSTAIDPASFGKADAIAIVPALSIDPQGYRLGYGGGYYDRFLPTFPGTSIGLCQKAQLSSTSLPRDETDHPVDIVVTA